MTLPSEFVNYYELLDIKPDANPAEISAGHVRAIARNSSPEHRKLCSEALDHLGNQEFRKGYNKILRTWTFDHLANGRTKAESIVSTVQQAENHMDQARGYLQNARELVFNCRHSNQGRIRRARTEVHQYCRSAADNVNRVQKWTNRVFEFCEEVNGHVRATIYLMPTKAKEIESQIQRAERRARRIQEDSQIIINEARTIEAEVEGLIAASPHGSGFVHNVRTTSSTISSILGWVNTTLDTSLNIVKLIGIFIAIFIGLGVILFIFFIFLGIIAAFSK